MELPSLEIKQGASLEEVFTAIQDLLNFSYLHTYSGTVIPPPLPKNFSS